MIRSIVLTAALVLATPVYAANCMASWCGSESGNRTASGERFNPNGMTAAHRSLPFGTRLRVCHRGCITVRISDRGPFIRGRCLDLSRGAARAIGVGGTARVHFERVN